MEEAWKQQWYPNLGARTPPEGGWDWPERYRAYKNHLDRFEVAIWSDHDRLSGLAIGKTNSHCVRVEILEGYPRPDCPLRGQALLIILQAATCYAQLLGKRYLCLMEPANAELERLYEDVYGFQMARPKKERPYCWREV